MLVLVINCGSSSLKFQLVNVESEEVLASGICDRIGLEGSVLRYKNNKGAKEERKNPMPDHSQAIRYVLEALTDKGIGVIGSLDEIAGSGHRFVHGGEHFKNSV